MPRPVPDIDNLLFDVGSRRGWNQIGGVGVPDGMGRPPRVHVPNTVSHVMGRGNGGDPIFRSDEDRLIFLGLLDRIARRCGALVLAVCLMTNHFHLLIEVGRVPLSHLMRRFLSRYARYFNRTAVRRGHLFQSRFLSKMCLTDEYYAAAFRYIHRNPVAAGMVAAPGDWPWSSHRQFVGGLRSTLLARDRALELLGGTPEAGRRRFLALMEEQSEFEPDFAPSDIEESPCVAPPPTLPELVAQLPSDLQTASGAGSGRRPRRRTAFRRALALAAAAHGYAGSEIAAFLAVSPGIVSRYLGEVG